MRVSMIPAGDTADNGARIARSFRENKHHRTSNEGVTCRSTEKSRQSPGGFSINQHWTDVSLPRT